MTLGCSDLLSSASPLHPLTPFPTPSAGRLDDLHAFDPATMNWTLLSAALDAPRPSARERHGFTSAGGKLYVHGGYGIMADGYKGDCSLSLVLVLVPREPEAGAGRVPCRAVPGVKAGWGRPATECVNATLRLFVGQSCWMPQGIRGRNLYFGGLRNRNAKPSGGRYQACD